MAESNANSFVTIRKFSNAFNSAKFNVDRFYRLEFTEAQTTVNGPNHIVSALYRVVV
jgi:hypothetical protein